MVKISRATAERYWRDRKFFEQDRSFYVACREDPYKNGDLVAAKLGDRWMLGKVKRKHKYISVEMEDIDGVLRFPRSDVLPVVGLQTAVR